MDQDQILWYSNKIRGGIAEAACRSHFEALGYTVETYGVEHVAPHFAALMHADKALGNYAKSLGALRTAPDFLITRYRPEATPSVSGKVEALLVEAKFRSDAIFEEIETEFFARYQSHIEAGQRVLIYLVSPRSRRKRTEEVTSQGPLVHLCFYSKAVFLGKPNHAGGFVPAGHPMLAELPLYKGMEDGDDFNTIYQSVVEPALRPLFTR